LIRKGCLKSIVSRRERVVISRDRHFRTGREMRLRPWLTVRAFPANSYRFLAEWGAFARFRAIRRSAPCIWPLHSHVAGVSGKVFRMKLRVGFEIRIPAADTHDHGAGHTLHARL
jgi:hypothetical protein